MNGPFFFDTQASGRIGERGADGPAGATGPAGPAGPIGPNGSFTIVQRDLSDLELHALDTVPIVLTPDMGGILQMPIYSYYEINKTHLSGAGASSFFQFQYRGTAIQAIGGGSADLGSTRNFGNASDQPTIATNSGAIGLQNPAAGLGIQVRFDASYLPSTFSGTARVSLIIALISLRF